MIENYLKPDSSLPFYIIIKQIKRFAKSTAHSMENTKADTKSLYLVALETRIGIN